jgi:hypothetical protein
MEREPLGVDLDKSGQPRSIFATDPTETVSQTTVREVLALRHCVRLWQMVQANDQENLAKHIQRVDLGQLKVEVRYDSHPDLSPGEEPPPPDFRETSVIATLATHPDLVQQFGPKEIQEAATMHIDQVINRHLKGQIDARILRSRQGNKRAVHLFPRNLLAALWVQFMESVLGDKKPKLCFVCRHWFQLKHHDDKVYCSDACKSKADRDRAKARAERKRRTPLKEIAEKLGYDVAVIKKWCSSKKGD